MKLKRLKLSQFRQFQDAEVQFGEGLIAIVGPNGAGKSTLLEAISYALFGKPRAETLVDDIRNLWAKDGSKFSVTLEFELGALRYEVQRGEKSAHLREFCEGKEQVLASGKIEVTGRCEQLLGMNLQRFKNSFCAEQKELAFLSFGKADAHREISRMLGFDKVKLAENLAREKRKLLKGRLDQIKSGLSDRDELVRALAKDLDELKAVRLSLTQNRESVGRLSQALAEAESARVLAHKYLQVSTEISQLESLIKRLELAFEAAVTQLRARLETVEERKALAKSESAYQALQARAKELAALQQAAQQSEIQLREIAIIEAQRKTVQEALHALPDPQIHLMQADLKGLEEALQEATRQLKEEEASWRDIQSKAEAALAGAQGALRQRQIALQASEAMIAKGLCPECGQVLGETVQRGVEQRKREVEESVAVCAELEQEKERSKAVPERLTHITKAQLNAQAALESHQQQFALAMGSQNERQRLNAEVIRLDGSLEKLNRERIPLPEGFDPHEASTVQSQIDRLLPDHNRYLAISNAEAELAIALDAHAEAQKELQTTKDQKANLTEEQKQMGFDSAARAQEAIDKFYASQSELGRLQSQIQEQERREQNSEQLVVIRQQALDLHDSQKEELQRLSDDDLRLELAAKELRGLSEDLNRRIFPELVLRASENLSLLTNGRYQRLALNPQDFKASLVEDDSTKKVVISGGEEDVVALSLRLALSEMIQQRQGFPFSLLILDEVFGSLDAERRQAVLSRLSALRQRFRQILVISHVEGIQEVADQSIVLVRDSESRSTKIESGEAQNPAFTLF